MTIKDVDNIVLTYLHTITVQGGKPRDIFIWPVPEMSRTDWEGVFIQPEKELSLVDRAHTKCRTCYDAPLKVMAAITRRITFVAS